MFLCQGLRQFLRERFRRGRILTCDELSIYDDASLQLYNPCHSTISEDIWYECAPPSLELFRRHLQFLDFVLHKEGSILIIVINVRIVKRRVSQYLNISGSFLFCIRKSGNFLASKD